MPATMGLVQFQTLGVRLHRLLDCRVVVLCAKRGFILLTVTYAEIKIPCLGPCFQIWNVFLSAPGTIIYTFVRSMAISRYRSNAKNCFQNNQGYLHVNRFGSVEVCF